MFKYSKSGLNRMKSKVLPCKTHTISKIQGITNLQSNESAFPTSKPKFTISCILILQLCSWFPNLLNSSQFSLQT